MKAVSLRQPWAWAVLEGGLTLLPRWGAIEYRGPLWIHAAQSVDLQAVQAMTQIRLAVPARLPRGGFVGRVELVGCISQRAAQARGAHWIRHRYAWLVESPQPCPIRPCRGYPGLWDVDDQPRLALTTTE